MKKALIGVAVGVTIASVAIAVAMCVANKEFFDEFNCELHKGDDKSGECA